jgi:hypothetical protein
LLAAHGNIQDLQNMPFGVYGQFPWSTGTGAMKNLLD